MTGRVSRILGVTAGLAMVGGTGGAALGALLGLGLASIRSGFAPPPVETFLAVGALLGALMGGLLVPTVACTRLRTVPLGRLVGGIGGAVAIGAALAWIVQPWWAPLGAVAGFVLGIRRLQRSQRHVAAAEHLV
jgi:hypothetical protein